MKIGNYTTPKNRLLGLIEDTKKVYEKFPSEEIESELFAHTIGQSPKSGSWFQKLADLRAYGLIEGRGKIKVSELGKKVTYGHDEEKAEALEKMIRNIPLWGILLDKYGVSIEKENFWIDLVKITGVERLEAQTKSDDIRKAYLEDVRYYKPVEKPSEPVNSSKPPMSGEINRNGNMDTPQIPNTTNIIGYIGFPEYSKAPIEIKDEISYNIARQLLEAIGNKLKEKNSKEVTNNKGENQVSAE